MKKILSFLLAGVAALGLIGCSGDLHDYGDAPNPVLSGGAIPGAFNGWTNTTAWTTADDATFTYTYEFSATAAEIEFKAITLSGEWNSGAYGSGDNTVIVPVGGDAVALVYDNASGGGDNAKITGLTVGSGYKLTVSCVAAVVYAKVEEVKLPLDLMDDRAFYAVGDFNGWKHEALTRVSASEFTYDFTATAATHEFGLATQGWATKYTGATLAAGAGEMKLTKGAGSNNNITGLTAGSAYTITFRTTVDSEVYAKVTAK